MPGITVLKQPYKVGRQTGSRVNIKIDKDWWVIKKRWKSETDDAMQARVRKDVDKLLKGEVRSCFPNVARLTASLT